LHTGGCFEVIADWNESIMPSIIYNKSRKKDKKYKAEKPKFI
jgi:hypothetical protein